MFKDDVDFVSMAPGDASILLFIKETSICMRGGVYHPETKRFFFSRKGAIDYGLDGGDIIKANFVMFPAWTGNGWVRGRHNGICVSKYAKELLELCKLMWAPLKEAEPNVPQDEITFKHAIRFAERAIERGALYDITTSALGDDNSQIKTKPKGV